MVAGSSRHLTTGVVLQCKKRDVDAVPDVYEKSSACTAENGLFPERTALHFLRIMTPFQNVVLGLPEEFLSQRGTGNPLHNQPPSGTLQQLTLPMCPFVGQGSRHTTTVAEAEIWTSGDQQPATDLIGTFLERPTRSILQKSDLNLK